MLRAACARWLLIVSGLCAAGGCSSSSPHDIKNPKAVHPVVGKVFVSNKPAVGAFVLLVPVNDAAENPDPRPRAEVKEDGTFALSTYKDSDGAPVGDYVVTIRWPGGVRPDGSEEPADKLMGRYSDAATTKLRATVKEGPNEFPRFDLR